MREPITVGGHLRIRPFNTADTYPEQRLDNDLCQAVVAGDTVYLRGQVAQDLDTRESVAVGDPAGQAEQVMTTSRRCSPSAARPSSTWCPAPSTSPTSATASRSTACSAGASTGVYPVFTGLVVSALARPEWLVEVTVVAVRP